MRIDVLKVTNFRCFEESTFRFHPSFNCIIGENGAGKTAILDAITIAIEAWFLGIPWHDGKRPIQYGRQIENSDIRRIYRQTQERHFDERPQMPVVVQASGEILGRRELSWTRERPQGGNTRNTAAKHIKELAEKAVDAINHFEPVTLPVISYYGTSRLGKEQYDMVSDPEKLAEADYPLAGYRASLDPRWNSKELIRWLLRQKWIEFEAGSPSAAYRIVTAAILRCLEGAGQIDFNVASGMVLIELANTGWRPYAEMSDGQRNIFSLVGDLAQKCAVLNPHLGDDVLSLTPGVVLVDELDLHLHPTLQRSIVHNLQDIFPKVQFFVTTHSPQIISEIEADKLIALNRGGGVVNIDHSYGFDANSILRRIMGTTSRPADVQSLISRAEDQIDDIQFSGARKTLSRLNAILGREDPEVIGLEASLNTLEALAD